MTKTETYTYIPRKDIDTCKVSFDFEYIEEDGKIIIKELTVDGERGCIGHNKTMSLLVKDRVVQELPLDELSEAGCRRESSCSQELVKALETMLKYRYKK
ncbi:MAG: TSCPD domain-containing protein [Asgard group archaeon]|nr:TSCPD domain-containing protein [Asgard group archaeon]